MAKMVLEEMKNKIMCSDSVQGMKKLPDESLDLAILSPPYDQMRDYEGNPDFDLHETGKQLYRILKEGSICAMVIQDQTKNFAKSLTSFRTVVDWCDSFGFRLFECCIYKKNGTPGAWWAKRFRVDHEYIFLFLKGDRPAYFNKEPLKINAKYAGLVSNGYGCRRTDGSTARSSVKKIDNKKCRGTIWNYTNDILSENLNKKLKKQHPATMPDRLPFDIIQCFSREGNIVIDPFIGSGSTAISALELNRNFIGFEISEKYVKIAKTIIKTWERNKYENDMFA